ncbi:hypothetical protein NDA14_003920 [Ustilago hordei]|nr:hypothetical protein NDA14_003920 [Ustilago hordei]
MNLTPNMDNELPYQVMFSRSPDHFIWLLQVFGCLAWVNIPKVKQYDKRLDQQVVPAILIGYSLERKGWLFYSPNYRLNIFWSNSARFLEDKSWLDHTEWQPIDMGPLPALKDEEELDNLGYTEKDLFDEKDQEPLQEYLDMETAAGFDKYEMPSTRNGPPQEDHEGETMEEAMDNATDTAFGLKATNIKEEKNLNPMVWEALARTDKRFWVEVMQKELEGLEAMGMWEIADLLPGMNAIDTCWVLKIKMDANMVPTKFKARLVARGFMQREGVDYMEIIVPVAPIQSI